MTICISYGASSYSGFRWILPCVLIYGGTLSSWSLFQCGEPGIALGLAMYSLAASIVAKRKFNWFMVSKVFILCLSRFVLLFALLASLLLAACSLRLLLLWRCRI